MSKIVSALVLLIYIIPFGVALKVEYILSFILVCGYVLFFYFGVLIVGLISDERIVVDHSEKYNGSGGIINILFIIYICARHQQILDMVTNYINGSYSDWVLQNALDRYAYDEDPGVVWKLGTIVYVCLMTTIGSARKLISRKHLIFIISSFLIETSQLGRATTLIATAMLTVEYLIRSNKSFYYVDLKRKLIYGILGVLLLSIIFFTSAYMRLTDDDAVIEILFNKLLVYTIAMYQAFYVWMSDYSLDTITFGFYTFTPVFKLFGYEVTQGLYPLVATDFGSTNIYTNLRGIIADFSIVGPCILFLFAGIYVKFLTHSKLDKANYFVLRFLILMIIYIIYSPFFFSTVLTGWVLSYFIVIVTSDIRR